MATMAKNRKAYFDYDLVKKFEAGIQLTGAEVKSIKNGRIQMRDSFIRIDQNGEAYLYNCYIAPYAHSHNKEYDPYRARKLLLHRNQLDEMEIKSKGSNLTIIPTRVYNTRRDLIKLEVAIAKGKKQYEKRRKIKERDVKRDIDRTLKNKK